MFTAKIKDIWENTEGRKKIFIVACTAIILLSIIRFSVWFARKHRSSGPSVYLKQLESKNTEEKKYAIYTLGQTGVVSAIPELEKILKEDPNLDIKRVAAWGMATLDKNKLLALVDCPDKDVKYIVMETLMKIDKGNIEYLVKKFSEQDEDIKQKILSYIESAAPHSYQKQLIEIAENTQEPLGIRKKSLEMLKTRDIQEIENRLWNLYYNDPNDEIKKTAYETIQRH